MGGSVLGGDCEFAPYSNDVRNIVLVGQTGNGKSSTGNSILGTDAFRSELNVSGVTATCELQSTNLENGLNLNVKEHLKTISEMVESNLRENMYKLEKQLAEEQVARLKLEAAANDAQKQSDEKVRKLIEDLDKAKKETDEQNNDAQKQADEKIRKLIEDLEKAKKETDELKGRWGCSIM